MKILVIDDEEDIRRIARLSLGKVGRMEVVDAASGVDGVRRAEEEGPDAILLDVMMPDLDGPSTFAALQRSPRASRIPVIFLTAKAMASEVDRLKGLGARGVLTKPFDPMTLADQVRAIIEGR
jgi:CheY-like chemotaxis protein